MSVPGELHPLAVAAKLGDRQVAKMLLKHGAPPNVVSVITGKTPLHLAAAVGSEEVVELLLAFGANSMMQDVRGLTPLMSAAYHGWAGVVEVILRHSRESLCKQCRTLNYTAMHFAVMGRHAEVIQSLASCDYDGMLLQLVDSDGRTPLLWGAFIGDDDCLLALLEAGASMTSGVADSQGRVPSSVAKLRSQRGRAAMRRQGSDDSFTSRMSVRSKPTQSSNLLQEPFHCETMFSPQRNELGGSTPYAHHTEAVPSSSGAGGNDGYLRIGAENDPAAKLAFDAQTSGNPDVSDSDGNSVDADSLIAPVHTSGGSPLKDSTSTTSTTSTTVTTTKSSTAASLAMSMFSASQAMPSTAFAATAGNGLIIDEDVTLELFQIINKTSSDNIIDATELEAALSTPGFKAFARKHGIDLKQTGNSSDNAARVMAALDLNHSGTVSVMEFLQNTTLLIQKRLEVAAPQRALQFSDVEAELVGVVGTQHFALF